MTTCPHCLVAFQDNDFRTLLGDDIDGQWLTVTYTCPACQRLVVYLINADAGTFHATTRGYSNVGTLEGINSRRLIIPRIAARKPCPTEVPDYIAKDYSRAALIMEDSPEASAALSRRCLQSVLRDTAKVKPGNLASEIQEVLDKKEFPSYLSEQIDAIRHIGNFGAHPMKSNSVDTIVGVEPQEAEWNLEVLELLFDFYYVQPVVAARKWAALDEKLRDVGKAGMK